MKTRTELETMVRDMALAAFTADVVQDVDCRRGEDHVGDPVVWTTIVVRDGRTPIGAQKTLPFGSAVSDAFREVGETAYPILSYVPVSEFRGVYPAAA